MGGHPPRPLDIVAGTLCPVWGHTGEKVPPKKKSGPVGRHAYDRPLWRSSFHYKDTAPGPHRYREVSTPIHMGGATQVRGRVGAKGKVGCGFLAPIEILCVQFLHAEFFLRS